MPIYRASVRIHKENHIPNTVTWFGAWHLLKYWGFFIAVFSLPGKLHCVSSFGYFCNIDDSNLALFISLNTRLLQDIKACSLRLSFHGISFITHVSQVDLLPFTYLLNQIFSQSFITLDGTQPLAAHPPDNPAVFN